MKKLFALGLIVMVISVLLQIYRMNLGFLRFGRSFNDTRHELGVPLIGENFRTDNYLVWYNESTNYPRHTMKELTISGFNLKIEQDIFAYMKDSVKVTAYSYYHYEEKCYNIYLSQGGDRKKIPCDSLVKILAEQGIPVKINCKECRDLSSK